MKANKKHPMKMNKERDALEDCALSTYNGLKDNCGETLAEIEKCLAQNPASWKLCTPLREKLNECAVRSKLGELSKS